jgi:hypothetical protein
MRCSDALFGCAVRLSRPKGGQRDADYVKLIGGGKPVRRIPLIYICMWEGVRGLRDQARDHLTRSAAAQGCANAVGAWMRWSGCPLLQGEGVLIVGLAAVSSGQTKAPSPVGRRMG